MEHPYENLDIAPEVYIDLLRAFLGSGENKQLRSQLIPTVPIGGLTLQICKLKSK